MEFGNVILHCLFPRQTKFSSQPLRLVFHLSLQKLVGVHRPLKLQIGLLHGLKGQLLVVIRDLYLLGKSQHLTLGLMSLYLQGLNLGQGGFQLRSILRLICFHILSLNFYFLQFLFSRGQLVHGGLIPYLNVHKGLLTFQCKT